MDTLVNSIDEIQNEIIKFNTINANNKILNLLDETVNFVNSKGNQEIENELVNVIKFIELAMGNKDYLFISDLLEYEIKEIIKSIGKE